MLGAAKQLIKLKLHRQYRYIKRISHSYPQHKKSCFDTEKVILNQLQCLNFADNYSSILGIEGYCAKVYFSTLSKIIPEELLFNGRKKRPASDPVNALLSLSYTIFSSRCSQALISVGLDPYIGFYHQPDFGRHSLAADMIEPWRPLIDRFVISLFKQKIIKAEYFDYTGNNCLLGKKGRSIFYPEFESQMKIWRKGLDKMARYMCRELLAGTEKKSPQPGQLSLF